MSGPALRLAVELDGEGAHPAAWRRAAHSPDHLLTSRRVSRVAAAAENAGFTLITLEDSALPPGGSPDNPSGVAGRIGAVERAAFIAASTSVIGVAPVVPVTYAEPFHVSSQLASLDHVSTGRAGWVVSEETRPAAARAWDRPLVDGAAARARESRDGVEVVRALWDSWEDDAVIRSVATSRYLDRDRLHYVDFTGDTFTVKGPAIVPRPPQGQLVVLGSPDLVPAGLLDVGLVAGRGLAEVATAAAAAGTARTFAEIEVALDTSDASAGERVADLERHAPWADRGRLRHVGSATGLAALLGRLRGVVDGVRLHPLVVDEDLEVLSRLVLPYLFEQRHAVRPLPGTTLRGRLGLERPANRYAADAGTGVGTDVRTGVGTGTGLSVSAQVQIQAQGQGRAQGQVPASASASGSRSGSGSGSGSASDSEETR
ncbi:alkanesulfonate monooxygenase SsuD/methylene tetrahydromethanopterin reductase-like flavin-dependent oxidoreductase (luciferase family) [Streptomyces sp. V3I8]|uniref:LLM class flavin-dependent oxidoreductase n=1 Tax=Streptomyces sp. V3I8 TaxID=3042279 RepID=UPI0027807750|nr:LLM class flavin-dependent oxidoreductase [Streptomyces sp. V3I8]MDQ1033951.1 alkanesulfonate monooxygenase SsuD/methylene tetrahydromethanopterin reductase-like flavin-dependent oxidoreductase (luciferase family) [Streptomyces sp. V3I8]